MARNIIWSDNKMTYLEEACKKKSDRYVSKLVSETHLKKKLKVTYFLFTTTAIIMGLLILTTILAIISGSISHTTILVDVLMIIWHFILIVRISIIEKELDSKDVNTSNLGKKDSNKDENIDWI